MVKLDLPDTETFRENNWALVQLQLNLDVVADVTVSVIDIAITEKNNKDSTEKIKKLADRLHSDVEVGKGMNAEEKMNALLEIVYPTVSKILTQSMSWGDNTIRMVRKMHHLYMHCFARIIPE